MDNVKVLVTAQYYENYNVGPDGVNTFGDGEPQWKPKGAANFQLEVDSDDLLYCTDANAILKEMVESLSDDYNKYEYRGYELQWAEPTKLDATVFSKMAAEQWNSM